MGSKSSKPKQPEKTQKQQPIPQKPTPKLNGKPKPVDSPNEWIYEYVLQFLVCPIWKNPIYQFLDDYCALFEDEEENQIGHLALHKEFVKMIEGLINKLIDEIQIDEDTLRKIVERGLRSKNYHKYFEQLLVVDDFMIFKKIMIKRNSQLEFEALEQLVQQEDNLKDQDALRLAQLTKEQAELEHALAVQQNIEKQRQNLDLQEEDELQQALQESKILFEKQQSEILECKNEEQMKKDLEQQKQQEDIQKQLELKRQEELQQQQENEKKIQAEIQRQKEKEAAEFAKKEQERFLQMQELKKSQQAEKVRLEEEKRRKAEAEAQAKKLKEEQEKAAKLKEEESKRIVAKSEEEFNSIQKQLADIRKQVESELTKPKDGQKGGETPEQRKQRLQKQRDLIKLQKQSERQDELKRYEETGKVDLSQKQQQPFVVDSTDIQDEEKRKKELVLKKKQMMEKIKADLKNE